MKEGGARVETGGIRSRRSLAGPRPQPWWWPTVEPTEGGAMEEWWPPTPGGRPTVAEQVVEEPETESQRARGMPRIRGARVEPRALATKAKAELRRSAAEPERLRTQVELKGGKSPTEPVGQSDEAQPEERSPEAMAGRCLTKAEPEGRGSPVELVDRWVMMEARELGAEVEPLGLQTETESGPRRRRWGKLQSRRHWRMAVPWGSHHIDGGLRASRGGIFEERALENLKPPQGWTRESRTKEGWTEPAGTMERGEGAVRSPEQHPSLSDPAPCLAVPDVLTAHPQPRCRGQSSTPRSHRPRLAPSWWALSPALAPGLTGWAQLPGRSA